MKPYRFDVALWCKAQQRPKGGGINLHQSDNWEVDYVAL